MIVCASCQNPNVSGSLFCTECGTPLSSADPLRTQQVETGRMEEVIRQKRAAPGAAPAVVLNDWVTLHLLDTGQMLPLADRNEFTLGRISDGQPIMPDIDLAPYQAYARGVSRLHVVLKREGSRVFLMDLGSANGTFVNGKRLSPNVDHAIGNGDVIALGKLKIQVLLKS